MRRKPLQLTDTDVLVLRALNRFRYLTAAQLNRVLWPDNRRDENRYAQRRLSRLVKDEYVLPLAELPKPARGTAPRVHALAWRGRQALQAIGDTVPSYYRPAELTEASRNPLFMPHTLAVVDVLVALEQLTQEVPGVSLQELLLERDLRRKGLKATVPAGGGVLQPRRVTVVPDAFFTLSVAGGLQHFLLEVDRDTERQHQWREKVAALAFWLTSPASRTLVPTPSVTVMVTTPSVRRREQLRLWTQQELRERRLFEDFAGIFMLTSVSPLDVAPAAFFGEAHWHPAYLGATDSLIDLPALSAQEP
ncbi:replication-relaxation family protein [Geodermatophilus sp. SYSU D00758]